jgi:hypothetical protein
MLSNRRNYKLDPKIHLMTFRAVFGFQESLSPTYLEGLGSSSQLVARTYEEEMVLYAISLELREAHCDPIHEFKNELHHTAINNSINHHKHKHSDSPFHDS